MARAKVRSPQAKFDNFEDIFNSLLSICSSWMVVASVPVLPLLYTYMEYTVVLQLVDRNED